MSEPPTTPHIESPQKGRNTFWNTKRRMLPWNTALVNVWKTFFLLSFLGKRVLSIVTDTDCFLQDWFSLISKCLLGTWLLQIKITFPSFPYSQCFSYYCCVTNYPRIERLKTTFLLCSQIPWVRISERASSGWLLLSYWHDFYESCRKPIQIQRRGTNISTLDGGVAWSHGRRAHGTGDIFVVTFGKFSLSHHCCGHLD